MRILSVAVALILTAGILHADVVSLKDGSVIECKIIQQTIKNGKQVMIVEVEGGKRQTVLMERIAWVAKAKPSWEIRKAEQAWYAKEIEKKAEKLETRWKDNESLATKCKRKKYLNAETDKHYQKAYELRVKETKATIKDQEKLAKWLEKPCALFGLAAKHWTFSYNERLKKLEATTEDISAKKYLSLAKWSEKKNLYDAAKQCYTKALEIDPKNKTARKGLDRIKRLQETLINPKLFRTIKADFAKAVGYYKKKQNKDGSFGGDVRVAGIQGHRAITALSALGLMGEWEFASVDDPGATKKMPKELKTSLDWLLGQPTNYKKLRGPDCWGNIFALHLFAKILESNAMKSYHTKVKSKVEECISLLKQISGPDGGVAYYHFAKKTSGSFTGAPLILALIRLKQLKVNVDTAFLDRLVGHLAKMKQSDGIFMYRTTVKQKVEGCQGRGAVCELALFRAGKGSKQAIQIAAENFFKYRHILEAVKGKRGTHIGSGSTAPYYFIFGHMWFAQAVKEFDAGTRDKYLSRMRDLFLKDQESDGSFTDWPMAKLHKEYGAAMGAWTLYHIGTLDKKIDASRRR